jgi:hypothetical protein
MKKSYLLVAVFVVLILFLVLVSAMKIDSVLRKQINDDYRDCRGDSLEVRKNSSFTCRMEYKNMRTLCREDYKVCNLAAKNASVVIDNSTNSTSVNSTLRREGMRACRGTYKDCRTTVRDTYKECRDGARLNYTSSFNLCKDEKAAALLAGQNLTSTNSTGSSASSGGINCSSDVKQCWDGSFVARNPENRCRFDKCPKRNK